MQFAKTMQESLLVDVTDMIAVKKVDIQDTGALHCIFLQFKSTDVSDQNPSIASDKILSMITNTKERLVAYLRYNKALDGTASSLPKRVLANKKMGTIYMLSNVNIQIVLCYQHVS